MCVENNVVVFKENLKIFCWSVAARLGKQGRETVHSGHGRA